MAQQRGLTKGTMMLYFGVLYIGDIFINKTGYNKEPQKLPNPRFGVKVKVKSLSRVQLFPTPWTVAYQAPPTMGFSRQEYWSGSPFPPPRFRKGLLIVLKHLKGFQMTALWNYTE